MSNTYEKVNGSAGRGRKNKRIWFCVINAVLIAAFCLQLFVPGKNFDSTAVSSSGFTVSEVGKDVEKLGLNFLDTERAQPGLLKADDDIWVIVELSGDALVDRAGAMSVKEYAATPAARSQLLALEQGRDGLKGRLKKEFPYIVFKNDYKTVINGFSAKIKYGDLNKLKGIGGVKKVTVSESYAAPKSIQGGVVNDVNVYSTGIYDSSDAPFDGTGTVVAILDTGLDYTHAAFSKMPAQEPLTMSLVEGVVDQSVAAGLTPGLTADDVYINAKIPFAYDYADNNPDVFPRDSHGTHVAGIVAGYDDRTFNGGSTVFKGVVPGAQLAIFKVFSSSTESGSMADVVSALEDALLIGVDVINLSLGAANGFTTADDEVRTDEIYQKVKDAGITIIAAAGNEGSSAYGSTKGNTNLVTNPDSATIGSPATYDATLSVASINGIKSDYFVANGETYSYINPARDSSSNKIDFVSNFLKGSESVTEQYVTVPGVGRSNNYSGIDVRGKIALVKRGIINFEDKIKNAATAGAKGVIIYNNISGSLNMTVGKANMIPSCTIIMDTGELLAAKATGTIEFNSSFKAGPFIDDFSSWGVNPDLQLSPEITAHGGDITSSVPGGYEVLSGTSMAAPNTAGAVVILRQYLKSEYPELTPTELSEMTNRLTMSTATIAKNEEGNPYSPRKQGAGLASISNAVKAEAYLYVKGTDKTKLSAGDDKQKTGEYKLSFNIKNLKATARSYRVFTDTFTETVSSDEKTVAEKAHMLGAGSVSVSSETAYVKGNIVTVGGYGDETVTVTVKLSEEEKQYIDGNFANGMYIDGFVRLEPVESGVKLNVPWVAFYGDWTRAPIFDVTAYQVGDSKVDSSVPDDEKLLPDVYASMPLGTVAYNNDILYMGLGEYSFTAADDSLKPATREDKAAITENIDGISGIAAVGLGTIRNAKKVDVTVENSITGKQIYNQSTLNVRKAQSTGSFWAPGFAKAEVDTYGMGLANNTKYDITAKGYVDYGDGGGDTNLNNTFKSSFYVDSENPRLLNDKLELRVEEANNTKRYYLDMYVYDNHYLQAFTICTYSHIEENTIMNPVYFENYLVPIDSKRGETNKVTYEITDYWNEIRSNNNNIYVEFADYALNFSGWAVTLPHKPVSSVSFTNTAAKTININEVADLKDELTSEPIDAWKDGLTWTSTDSTVVSVSDGVITGKKEGSAVIKVSALNEKGKTVSASRTVNVTSTPHNVTLQKLAMDKSVINAVIGDTGILSVNVMPYSYNANLTWTSSSPELVEITPITGTNTARYRVLKGSTTTVTIRAADASSTLIRATSLINIKPVFEMENNSLISYTGKGAVVNGQEGVVDIPADLDALYIGGNAFKNNKHITKVIIPEGVKLISESAFEGCTSLREIVLPQSLKSIGISAFSGCSALTTANLENVQIFYAGSFSGTRLNEVNFDSAYFIGDYAFEGTVYGASTFATLDLSRVGFVGTGAFLMSGNLQEVVMGAQTVSPYVFAGSLKLERVTFLNKVTVGDWAFTMCERLNSIVYDKGCYSIGIEAFSYCNSLTSVRLPAGLEKVGEMAFYSCQKLSEAVITAASDVKSFGFAAFGRTKIKSFTVEAGASAYTWADGVVYNADRSELVLFPCAKNLHGSGGAFEVPDGVTSIANYAFAYAGNYVPDPTDPDYGSYTGFTAVDLNEVVTIRTAVFYGCSKLDDVVFNANLKVIGDGAFKDCPQLLSLAGLSLAVNLESIGMVAFSNEPADVGALYTLTIPAKVAFIGEGAFAHNDSIEVVDLSAAVYLTALGTGAFDKCRNITDVILPDNLEYIGEYAFSECRNLVNINIPANLKAFGRMAFYYCEKLSVITLPEGLETISYGLFAGTAIVTINLPESVTVIEGEAFIDCRSFEGFAGEGLKYIQSVGDYAFINTKMIEFDAPALVQAGSALFGTAMADGTVYKNEYLTRVNLPEAVIISDRAFWLCEKLTEVNIPKARYIGSAAFRYCEALEQIELPAVTEIGAYAFAGAAIREISLPASLAVLGEGALSGMPELESVEADKDNTLFFSDDGVLYSVLLKEGYQLECYPTKKNDTAYTVLDDTKRIAADSFTSNAYLRQVNLPYSLLSIGNGAFFETGINVYTFASLYMPALEGYVYSAGYGVVYYNFNDYFGSTEGLTVVFPGNGTGYDSAIMELFFDYFIKTTDAPYENTLAVIKLIDMIPANVTINDKELIYAARAAFNALISSQKELVGNYPKLEKSEAALNEILLKAEIEDLIARIDELPKKIRENNRQNVLSLYDRYNVLTDENKAKITNAQILLDAVAALDRLGRFKFNTLSLILTIVLGLALAGAAAMLVIHLSGKRRNKPAIEKTEEPVAEKADVKAEEPVAETAEEPAAVKTEEPAEETAEETAGVKTEEPAEETVGETKAETEMKPQKTKAAAKKKPSGDEAEKTPAAGGQEKKTSAKKPAKKGAGKEAEHE